MKYAHIEENTNRILGWYDTDINFKMEDKSKSFILDNKDLTDTEIIDNLKKTEEYQSLSNIVDTQIDRENLVINVSYEEKVLLIPENAIKVSEEDWQEAININANCYEDGKFIVKDFRTDEEIRKEEINTQLAEAKAYLSSTDFYMTVDKYSELDEVRKVELTTKRAEARKLINTLEIELEGL